MLIDTHTHLTDPVYGGAEQIVREMRADGLSRVISVGYDLTTSAGARKIAESNPDVYFTAGVHPSEVEDLPDGFCDTLLGMAKSGKCVAIGEIGLDYHYPDFDADRQKRVLLRQLEVCAQTGLPAVFHVRDAYGDMTEIVKNNLDKLPARGVVHCFSGSKETALEYVRLGFYISFTGSITFKNAVKFPEILSSLPRDRVMVETDCPYLTPVPFRGQTNYPKYVRYVAARIAEIWGVTEEEVAQTTAQNAYACFGRLK